MRTNRELALAIKRALATGTLALCGAGAVAAYAQPTPTATATTTQATTRPATAAKAKPTKATAAKATTASAPILLAQTTPSPANTGPAPQQLQTIVITGSLIERTSVETPNPVQVLSTKDLVQSGYTDISDVMRNISANGANTLSPSFSFAFATGGSGISLRGLTLGDTLVLVDGERTVPYPLLDDNERSFVDLSSIPFTAVQQVQVLKDGGSALYGSDAIAGVVNVILRKEYQGLSVTAESGTSQHWDGTSEHIGFIGGVGDLASDGYNWYLSGDIRHQDDVLAKNRSGVWDTLDFTPWGGNDLYPGANQALNPGANGFPSSLTGYLVDPTTGAETFLPGCNALAQNLNRCYATGPQAQLAPSSTNVDLLGKFTKELAGGWEFGLQASWFDSRTEQMGEMATTNYPFGESLIGLLPGQAPNVITYPLTTVPATNPINTTGATQDLVYNFPELGEEQTVVNTNTYRLLMSLSGTVAGWQIKGTVGAMYAKMADTDYGAIQPGALQTALNNGYVLGSPTGTGLFAPPAEAIDTSNMSLVDIHGTHKLFEMPGGPVNLAVGVQWVKEGHDVQAPLTVAEAIQEGDATFAVGNEYDRAAFVELDGDPIKQLEIDAQARYDNYQTFGSDVTPKIGIKFTPWHWIALRGTYGKGFRAPSVAEGISSGEAFGEGSADDPALCPNPTTPDAPGNFPSQCAFPQTGVLLANAHLKDVTSTNWTTGIVLQPIQQASATVDYYNIKVNNDIVGATSLASFVGVPVRGPDVLLPYCPPTHVGDCTSAPGGGLVNTLTPEGTILEASYPYENASSTAVSGFDVDLAYHWDWGRIGRFAGEVTWTHELTYQLSLNGQTYELAGTHGPASVSGDTGNPKDRFNARLSWTKGPLTITPSVDFIGHFTITDPSAAPFTTCAYSLTYVDDFNYPTNGTVPADEKGFCNVKYFLETDLYGSYQLTANFEVHASVTNLFNKAPPVDAMTYGSGSYFYPYDAAFAEDGAIGRYFLVGLTYNF